MRRQKVRISKKEPFFSIVIPTRRVNNYIREAIPYYLAQTFQNFEIIIVTEFDEKEKFPKTRFVKVGKVSPAEKRNIGVKNANGDIIAFIDDDAYPKRDWLRNILKNFENAGIDAVGGPNLVPKKASFFQRVSNKVYELSSGKTGIRYGRGKRRKKIRVEEWPTCNFIVKKNDFLEVGGFDPRSWGGEDSQLCYSLVNKGKTIIFDPDVEVYHYPRETLKKHIRQTFFWALWKGHLIKKYPKNVFKLTFLVPSLFVLWLIFGGIASLFFNPLKYLYFFILGIYMLFLLSIGFRSGSAKMFFPVMWITFLSQVVYGIGFIKGLLLFMEPTKKTFNPAESIEVKK